MVRYVVAAAIWTVSISAQSPQTAAQRDVQFEVASIRPCVPQSPDEFMSMLQFTPNTGPRFFKPCISLSQLVLFAYNLPPSRVRGLTDRTTFGPYSVDARSTVAADIDEMRLIVRGLLRDRFGLESHREVVPSRVYALVLARADGRLGPNAKKADFDCSPFRDGRSDPSLAPKDTVTGRSRCDAASEIVSASVTTRVNGITMSDFASRTISGRLGGAIVIDRTGLKEIFDLTLSFPLEIPGTRDGVATANVAPTDFSPLLNVLNRQLGLKLEPRTEPVEVLVIDQVKAPTPD